MTELQRKLTTAVATGALLLNAFTSVAFASTTIEISGNGSSSESTADVDKTTTTTVVQSNSAYISNNVDSDASTGNNDANDNTGGDVVIDTGSAASTVDVSTSANVNRADVKNCDCDTDSQVLISGNGSYSENEAELDTTSDTSVFQTNDAYISNYVDADASTGHNDAKRNTGGDVVISTGNASAEVGVSNVANANTASIGGNGHNGGSVDLRIIGNGSKSDNDIDLDLARSITLVQDNSAYISNWIDADAKTGHNDANDNTGGDVVIDTGWAKAKVGVDNMVNFNVAEAGCDCLLDVLAKVSGNGSESENEIEADLSEDLTVFQDNLNYLDNWVDANAKTGHNDAKRNTGPVLHDPVEILTGAALDETSVTNSGNVNVFGPHGDFHLPGDFDFGFHFDFNLSDLLGILHVS